MKILVDADALPNMIKEILFRAAERVCISLIMVSNKNLKIPRSTYISSIVVPGGPDVADDRIAEMVEEGDLVITADIPLAARVVEKNAYAIDPRGELYTEENVRQRLALRDFMDELRSTGVETGGPSSFGRKDRQAFADQLNRFLTSHCTV